jgi:hypothetical protein
MVIGSETANGCSDDKTCIASEKNLFSVEAIDEKCTGEAGHSRRNGVGGHQQTELLGIDGQFLHELISHWHHDHKIHDMGEVDNSQRKKKPDLFGR